MKILRNVTIEKLREYRQSYGNKELVNYPFVLVFEKNISLLDKYGNHVRTMIIGTKLLISFSGSEISERSFKILTNKAKKEAFKLSEIAVIEQKKKIEATLEIVAKQKADLYYFFQNNPEKIDKFKKAIESMSSSKWRNKLRMLAAKYINNEKFDGMELSAVDIREVVYTFN